MKKFISALTAVTLAAAALAVPMTYAEGEDEPAATEPSVTYTVTFLDFDGNEWSKLTVAPDETIDYTKLDTSSLHSYDGKYTEQAFAAWDKTPSTVDKDTTIRALYKKATIALEDVPQRTRYFYRKGEIDREGLKVVVSMETQSVDSKGKIKLTAEEIDITRSCELRPHVLSEVFRGNTNRTAEIEIYPIGEDQPLGSYTITCHDRHGDANDNGRVDALDAVNIMKAYAKSSSGTAADENYMFQADVDFDGKLTANDAALVMRYYATASGHHVPDWNELIFGKTE